MKRPPPQYKVPDHESDGDTAMTRRKGEVNRAVLSGFVGHTDFPHSRADRLQSVWREPMRFWIAPRRPRSPPLRSVPTAPQAPVLDRTEGRNAPILGTRSSVLSAALG
jgi:hypothetical protein